MSRALRTAAAFGILACLLLNACSGGGHGMLPATPGGPTSQISSGGVNESARARGGVQTGSVYPTMVVGDSPLGYYRLGDTGSVAYDSSGNGRNGMYVGVGAGLTQQTPGLLAADPGKSVTSSGNNRAYVVIPRNAAFANTAHVSIEAWVKETTTASTTQLIAEYGMGLGTTGYALTGGTQLRFMLAVPHGSSPYTLVIAGAGLPGNSVSAGTVYHVVGTYDGTAARLYVDGQLVGQVAVTGAIRYPAGFQNTGGRIFGGVPPTLGLNGSAQEVALYSAPLSQTQVQAHWSAGQTLYSEYDTFGYDVARTGYNPAEKVLGSQNAHSLRLYWSKALGGAIDAQPVIAPAVAVGSGKQNLLYVGTEDGNFYALNADSGNVVWQQTFAYQQSSCTDLPSGHFGITGTAAIDRANNRIFLADGNGQVHALDMSTGKELGGWPVTVTQNPSHNHIYGALTYNPQTGMLYAETASLCDAAPWNGEIAAISTSSASIVATFFPSTTGGAGIWGMGGASIDTTSNDVFVATGNGQVSEHNDYADDVVRLTSNLSVVAANFPNITGLDEDFGATPMLFHPPGCPLETTAKNKSGILVTYDAGNIGTGPLQTLQMASDTDEGIFIGVTAYDPVTNLVYVGDPDAVAPYDSGIVALAPQGDCTLALRWQQSAGGYNTNDDNAPPSVANGVVYFATGVGKALNAYDASSGASLWNSGSTIGGFTFTPPAVDGHVYIPAWDGNLYAFGL